MGAIALAIGAAVAIGGTAMSASAASKRKDKLNDIANTPGLDLNNIYSDSLGAMSSAQPKAESIAAENNTFNNDQLQKMLEKSIPGYGQMQGTRTANANALLRGEIPEDVRSQINRTTAARALGGGYAGTQAGRNLTARDLGMTSLNLMGLGQQYSQGILGSTPMSALQSPASMLTITPTQALATRGHERDLQLQMLTGAAMAPGASDVWGKALQDSGNSVASMGMSGMNPGGGGGANTQMLGNGGGSNRYV